MVLVPAMRYRSATGRVCSTRLLQDAHISGREPDVVVAVPVEMM